MKTKKVILAILTGLIALAAQAQTDMEDWLQNGRPECLDEPIHENIGNLKERRKIGSQATAPLKAHGVKHVPVVLVDFQDKTFISANTNEEVNAFYHLFCNGTMDGKLYRGHGSYGSVRDYFVTMSDSAFLPEFTVIGPVTLDNGYAYYGENNYNTSGKLIKHDKNFNKFCNESTAKAMEMYTDWDKFDNDGNGSIDMVFFVFAGLGESNGGDPNCLWPKETRNSSTINGRVVACNGATCEARPKTDDDGNVIGTRTDGIGVFCHELSHALGLPDFYDTESVAFGMDIWSIMDYGNYCGNGYSPVNYTAYERDFMGWQPLQELTEPCVLTIPCFADGGRGYKIVNEANPNEYYIIENRQARGWDTTLCGGTRHGLQVTHVEHNQSLWSSNDVNIDPNHQHMTIIAANNCYNGTNAANSLEEWMATLSGNLWPGNKYNYNLTDESTPAAKVYTGGLMHKPLRNITENADKTVTVCFRTNGILTIPEVGEAENVDTDAFTVVWNTVEHATQYVCELYLGDTRLQCDTLKECSFRYEELGNDTKFRFRIRAMADSPEDYIESAWSDFHEINTLPDIISPLITEKENHILYDLSGRRIATPRRGLYIKDGKKVVVR